MEAVLAKHLPSSLTRPHGFTHGRVKMLCSLFCARLRTIIPTPGKECYFFLARRARPMAPPSHCKWCFENTSSAPDCFSASKTGPSLWPVRKIKKVSGCNCLTKAKASLPLNPGTPLSENTMSKAPPSKAATNSALLENRDFTGDIDENSAGSGITYWPGRNKYLIVDNTVVGTGARLIEVNTNGSQPREITMIGFYDPEDIHWISGNTFVIAQEYHDLSNDS